MQQGRQPKNVEVKSIFNILDKCFYLLTSMINRCSFTGKRARYDPMTAVKLMASAGAAGQPAKLCFLSWLWVLVDVGEWQMLKRHWAQESWTDPLQYLSAGSKFFEDGKS